MSATIDQLLAEHPELSRLHSRLAIAESLATWIHRMEIMGKIEETQREGDD